MPQPDKSNPNDKPKRPQAQGRAWTTADKLHGPGKKIGAGRPMKVPSGPVGGSGRKTNLSRSS
jgi:hypothetical protein